MARAPLNMIDLCVKYKIKKLVAASSASVYGQAEDFPTTEKHHPYNNRTFYGACKTFNELMYRSYKDMYGLDYNTFRYFNVFGPRMDTEGKYTEVLIRWYYLIKEGKRPKIFGEGDQTMDFVYIDDIARATILGLTQDVSGEDFNVARGEEVSLKELCNALLKAMDSDLEPEFVPLPEERQKVEVGRRLASTEKAEKLLGFKAEVELEDGLRRLVAWLDGLEENSNDAHSKAVPCEEEAKAASEAICPAGSLRDLASRNLKTILLPTPGRSTPARFKLHHGLASRSARGRRRSRR